MTLESTQELYERIRSELGRYRGEMYIRLVLMLSAVGVDEEALHRLIQSIFKIIEENSVESVAVTLILQEMDGMTPPIAEKLLERGFYFEDLVRSHLLGDTLLDFGCGDGQVSVGLSYEKGDLLQYDVVDYRGSASRNQGHPFTTSWKEVQARGPFDSALSLMVLHHTEDPDAELGWLAAICKRLIVVESVVSYINPFPVQALVDWFYNRALHPGAEIPVSGRFRTDGEWRSEFARQGLNLAHSQDLGIDVLMCPEHHYLYVLDKQE